MATDAHKAPFDDTRRVLAEAVDALERVTRAQASEAAQEAQERERAAMAAAEQRARDLQAQVADLQVRLARAEGSLAAIRGQADGILRIVAGDPWPHPPGRADSPEPGGPAALPSGDAVVAASPPPDVRGEEQQRLLEALKQVHAENQALEERANSVERELERRRGD